MVEARFELGEFHFKHSSNKSVSDFANDIWHNYNIAKKSNLLMKLECTDGIKFVNPDQIKTIGITENKEEKC